MDDIQIVEEQAAPREERTIFAFPERTINGFVDFLRERGVATFAIGFIFGGASQTLIKALMDDMINPAIGLFLGPIDNLSAYHVGSFMIGDFVSNLISFLILCFVMYLIFRGLHLEKLDKPKQ